MPIVQDSIVLSSEIADLLKQPSGIPLKYIVEAPFATTYWNNWNSAATSLFSNANAQLNDAEKNSLLKSIQETQTSFPRIDIGKNTPTTFVDLPLESHVPVASFLDLLNFVTNAFLPATNIRKSRFSILEKVSRDSSDLILRNHYGYAFLTDAAILSTNPTSKNILNNANQNSQAIVSSYDSLSSYMSDASKAMIEELRPKAPNKLNIDVDKVSQTIAAISSIVFSDVADGLSCWFVDGKWDPNGKITVTYHNRNSRSASGHYTVSDTVPIYSEYRLSGFSALWPRDTSFSQIFKSWTTVENSFVENTKYGAEKTIVIQNANIDLWPVFQQPVQIVYNFSNYDFTKNYIATVTESAYLNSTYAVKAFSSFSTKTSQGVKPSIVGNRYSLNDHSSSGQPLFGNLNTEFAYWSTNPNEDFYVLTSRHGSHSISEGNYGATLSYEKCFVQRRNPDKKTAFNGGTNITLNSSIISNNRLVLYPVFKVVTVSINTQQNELTAAKRLNLMCRYLDMPYNVNYYLYSDRFWTDLGLPAEFNAYSYDKLFNNINGVEVPALETIVDFSNPDSFRNMPLQNHCNGFKVAYAQETIKSLPNDGVEVRDVFATIGSIWGTEGGDRCAGDGKTNFVAAVSRGTSVTVDTNGGSGFGNVMGLCAAAFINESYYGISPTRIGPIRFSTSWVSEDNPICTNHTLSKINCTMRYSPWFGSFHGNPPINRSRINTTQTIQV